MEKDLLIKPWKQCLEPVSVAAARASGPGNRSLWLSPLLHGERRLNPASWSGQMHRMKTCTKQSCQPEVGCDLAFHLNSLTSPVWASPAGNERGLHGLGLAPGSVLETATCLPAQKTLLRSWWKNNNYKSHSAPDRRPVTWEPDVPCDKDLFHLSQSQGRGWSAALQAIAAEPWNKPGLFVILSCGFASYQVWPEAFFLYLFSRRCLFWTTCRNPNIREDLLLHKPGFRSLDPAGGSAPWHFLGEEWLSNDSLWSLGGSAEMSQEALKGTWTGRVLPAAAPPLLESEQLPSSPYYILKFHIRWDRK